MHHTAPPCARGCTIRGRHLRPCPCASDGHQHADDCPACRGCLPRPASTGWLCEPCAGRVTRALLDAPQLIAWIREHVIPGTYRGGRDDVLREAPAPLNGQAVDDADDLHALLAAWAVAFAELEGLRGPSWVGSAVRPATCRAVPIPGGGRRVSYHDARVVGLLSGADHEAAAYQVTSWLLAHAHAIAAREWAADWHDEIVDAVRAASGRWPREPHERKLPLPCPSCDRVMLWMHPPAGPPIRNRDGELVHAWETTVCCHADDCGRVLTEKDYYLQVEIVRKQLLTPRKERTA